MFRFIRIVPLVAVMLAVAPPATSFASTLDTDLATLWTKVLETPSAQNSFGDGGQAYAPESRKQHGGALCSEAV